MLAGLGFMMVVIASAFLDGDLWGAALVAAMIGALMMVLGRRDKWIAS